MGAVKWTGQRRCSKAKWPATGEGAEDRFWQMDGSLREQHSQRKAVPLAGTRSSYDRSLQCNLSICLNDVLVPLSRPPWLISFQLQCRSNSSQQNLVIEWLPEESERACLHGLRSRVGIIPSRDKNDGKSSMAGSQAALQFQATHSREPMIEDQTITTAAGRCDQKLLRRCVTLCLHTGYFEQAPNGTADLAFVVDDCDPVFHQASSVRGGYLASAVCVYWPLVLYQAIGKRPLPLSNGIHHGSARHPIARSLARIDRGWPTPAAKGAICQCILERACSTRNPAFRRSNGVRKTELVHESADELQHDLY
jgi:hypothetical protein